MGLFKKAGKSAAVMSTAKVVVGAVAKRLAKREQEKAGAQQPGQIPSARPATPAAPPPAPPAAPQAPADSSLGGQLQQLANLRQQGVLSEDEFTTAKARLLGT